MSRHDLRQHLTGLGQRSDERINILPRGVHADGCPHGSGYTEAVVDPAISLTGEAAAVLAVGHR